MGNVESPHPASPRKAGEQSRTGSKITDNFLIGNASSTILAVIVSSGYKRVLPE